MPMRAAALLTTAPGRFRAPLAAGLALLACGSTVPANAVITTVTDTGNNYAIALQVGSPSAIDTVQFNVTGNNVGLTPGPVTGTPAIDISVVPTRPANSDGTARPVTLQVDSSAGLTCQSTSCGTTIIPFSKISWTVSNSSGGSAGDIQNGQFNGAVNQQIASFNANATYCSFPIIIFCLGWVYQSNTMSATRLTFTYANDVIYPAGSYTGTVYFTASMQ